MPLISFSQGKNCRVVVFVVSMLRSLCLVFLGSVSLVLGDGRDPQLVEVPSVDVSHNDGQNGQELTPLEILLTIRVVPGNELEELVEYDDGQRELHDSHPLLEREGSDLENVLKGKGKT